MILSLYVWSKDLPLQYHADGARLSLGMAYGRWYDLECLTYLLSISCPSVNDCVTFTA